LEKADDTAYHYRECNHGRPTINTHFCEFFHIVISFLGNSCRGQYERSSACVGTYP
jgi:hypothetical protein